jgi:nicotinate-nucleotide pyrophosphorylase|tara:strand:+ start:3193 stop:3435 length:243 start_codon:yes stop_codon:yes gene_type:complete
MKRSHNSINNLETNKRQKINNKITNIQQINTFDNFDLLDNIQMDNLTLDEMNQLRKILDKKIRKYMQKMGNIEQILNIYL